MTCLKKFYSCIFFLFFAAIVIFGTSCEKENVGRPDLSGNYKGTLDWGTLDRAYGIDSGFTFNVKILSKDHIKLTLNTDAVLYLKEYDLYYTGLLFDDPNKTYLFSVPDSLHYSLYMSFTTLSKKVLYSDIHYSRLVPGNNEGFTGRGTKY